MQTDEMYDYGNECTLGAMNAFDGIHIPTIYTVHVTWIMSFHEWHLQYNNESSWHFTKPPFRHIRKSIIKIKNKRKK